MRESRFSNCRNWSSICCSGDVSTAATVTNTIDCDGETHINLIHSSREYEEGLWSVETVCLTYSIIPRYLHGRLLQTISFGCRQCLNSTSRLHLTVLPRYCRCGAGPFPSPVPYFVEHFTGSSPWSNIEFWQFSRKLLITQLLAIKLLHTLSAVEMVHDTALSKFTINIYIVNDKNAAKTDYKNPQWTARLSCKLQFIRHAFTQTFRQGCEGTNERTDQHTDAGVKICKRYANENAPVSICIWLMTSSTVENSLISSVAATTFSDASRFGQSCWHHNNNISCIQAQRHPVA